MTPEQAQAGVDEARDALARAEATEQTARNALAAAERAAEQAILEGRARDAVNARADVADAATALDEATTDVLRAQVAVCRATQALLGLDRVPAQEELIHTGKALAEATAAHNAAQERLHAATWGERDAASAAHAAENDLQAHLDRAERARAERVRALTGTPAPALASAATRTPTLLSQRELQVWEH